MKHYEAIGAVAIVAAACAAIAASIIAGCGLEKSRVTLDSLQTAYNCEAAAGKRYEAFAVKADEEGYKSVAVLFRAAADSEGIHAKGLAALITKRGYKPDMTDVQPVVGTTKENLEAALKGQTSEAESIYPELNKQAETIKDSEAAMRFKGAQLAEIEHSRFFKTALAALDEWKAPGKEFAVCQVCGFTVMGPPPAQCLVCSSPREKFKIFAK